MTPKPPDPSPGPAYAPWSTTPEGVWVAEMSDLSPLDKAVCPVPGCMRGWATFEPSTREGDVLFWDLKCTGGHLARIYND